MKKHVKELYKLFLLSLIGVCILLLLVGCTEVNRVNTNLGKEADNFNITRRIVVMNARTDTVMFELVGNFSLQNNDHGELEIICEVGNGLYKKHFIRLNENTLYVVEDVSGAFVDKYHYEVHYIPEMVQPITITTKD